LADDNAAKRQSDYANYIVRYYPGAKVSAPIKIIDDTSRDLLEVREYYEIERPFTKSDNVRFELFLQADELYSYLDTLKSSVRKAPLAVRYPAQVQQNVRALLPRKWKIHGGTVKIVNPAFRYEGTVGYSEGKDGPELTLAYYYESLADSVDLSALPQYQADRKRAYDDLGYSLWTPSETFVVAARAKPLATVPRRLAWLSFFFSLCIAFRFVFRWDPPPADTRPDWPVGLRGWLLVPAFAVVVSPLVLGVTVYQAAHWLDIDHWSDAHNTLSGSFKDAFAALIACGVFLLVTKALIVYLFFKRRTSAPRLFIVTYWATGVYAVFVAVVPVAAHLSQPFDNLTLALELMGGAAEAGAFTAYLLLSKRVKATFVARLPRTRTRVAVAAQPAG
jgi:hypothetical protein